MSEADQVPQPSGMARAAWLVQLVGTDPAFRIVEAFGGTDVLVPVKFTSRSRLVRETRIPPDTLAPLAEDRGGTHVRIPVCREWRVQVYRSRGLSHARIARDLSISQDTVSRILRRGEASPQMSLF